LAPQLGDRTDLGSFGKRAYPDTVKACLSVGGCRVEVGSAAIAEDKAPLVSIFSGFHIGRRQTLYEPKALANDEGGHSERSTGKHLAVGAMADTDSLQIDRRFKSNRLAMTASIHVHRESLLAHRNGFREKCVAIVCRERVRPRLVSRFIFPDGLRRPTSY